jgi:putative ATP-dependent endonuclease of the OLD family
MILSCLKLWNFRRFGSDAAFDLKKPHLVVWFRKGLNVLIGENDSGKSAIIDAIRLTLGTHSSEWTRIADDDFYGKSTRLRIELVFTDLTDEEAKHLIEWLSIEGKAPNCHVALHVNFDVKRSEERIFPSDVKAGADGEGHPLTAEAREYLRITYLRPLRDARNELVPRKNSRLSQILQGHELFKGKEDDHELKKLHDQFNADVEAYFEAVAAGGVAKAAAGEQLKKEIDRHLTSFYGEERKSVINAAVGSLKAILEKLEISLKDTINPGLGTLNRLFMASELVHLNKTGWHGLRLCLIEELEAHLHPQAQMQVIEALQRESEIQIILTTHSPNLASKVRLDSLIICAEGHAFPMGTDVEGKSYTKLGPADHDFLERFLDVTKANLFFARGVILVEGWAEELLVPALAKVMKRTGLISKNLTEARVSVINVGGTSQLRYANIFRRQQPPEIAVPIAVVADVDVPTWERSPQLGPDGKPVKNGNSYVYQFTKLPTGSVAADSAARVAELSAKYDQQTVKVFVAPEWTLEYSLLQSPVFKEAIGVALKAAHPQIDLAAMETELAAKLLNGGLDKTEVAHHLAKELEADLIRAVPKYLPQLNDSAGYLAQAIKYACRE